MNTPLALLLLMLAAFGQGAQAQIYKVVGPDGKVSYSDKEPQAEKAEKLKIQTYSGTPSVSSLDASVKRVTLFSAQWCGHCRAAKAYFNKNKIAFDEWDTDKSYYAQRKMKEFGTKSVPVILVGNQKMIGFSPESFEAMRGKAGM